MISIKLWKDGELMAIMVADQSTELLLRGENLDIENFDEPMKGFVNANSIHFTRCV